MKIDAPAPTGAVKDELDSLITKRSTFLRALATDVLECDPETFTPESTLDPWDSMSVMGCIVVIDDVYGKAVSGRELTECKTAGDVLKLVGEQ